MVKNADTARVIDVALMLGPLTRAMTGRYPASFDTPATLAQDLSSGNFELHERVLLAAIPR